MAEPSLDGLGVFASIARSGSFTRAAAMLGVSQPSLSRALRALEARLDVRLINRSTRSIALTTAGAALLADIEPALEAINEAVDRLHATSEEPAGTVRLTVDHHGYHAILAQALPSFLAKHSRVAVEVNLNDEFVDLIGSGFDAGLRLGEFVERDMIAVRVGPDAEIAVVGSPDYVAVAGEPVSPRDLNRHACIGYRKSRTGGIYAWEFQENGRRLSARVDCRLLFNDGAAIRAAALGGAGLAYLFRDQVAEDLEAGRLVRVLTDWCPSMPGFRLYHPSRRHQPSALAALIAHLTR